RARAVAERRQGGHGAGLQRSVRVPGRGADLVWGGEGARAAGGVRDGAVGRRGGGAWGVPGPAQWGRVVGGVARVRNGRDVSPAAVAEPPAVVTEARHGKPGGSPRERG